MLPRLWRHLTSISRFHRLASGYFPENGSALRDSSLAGPAFALLSTEAFRKADMIAKQMTYFELSVHPENSLKSFCLPLLPQTPKWSSSISAKELVGDESMPQKLH